MSHIIYARTKADVKISALMKIAALIKKLGAQVVRLLTIWAQQNLQLLTSSKSG